MPSALAIFKSWSGFGLRIPYSYFLLLRSLCRTEQSLAKLHKLLDNKPIEYVAMALYGEMQAYCDIENEMVKGMFGTIVQGYLKKGYNRATAEMMAREFLGMRVDINGFLGVNIV